MARKILIVDDSAVIRQVERTVLSGAGYEVVAAADGTDAMAKLEVHSFNLIITDLHMPGLDGVSLIKNIRGWKQHSHTPVVVITTESKADRKQEGKIAGATAWVVKPFAPDQLLAVVKRVIG